MILANPSYFLTITWLDITHCVCCDRSPWHNVHWASPSFPYVFGHNSLCLLRQVTVASRAGLTSILKSPELKERWVIKVTKPDLVEK